MRLLLDYMSQFEAVCRKYLYISDVDLPILKLILGAAVAQHLGPRTELFWLVLVAPSGSGKTTLLNPIISCTDLVVSRDDCTGSSMMSASDPDGLRARAQAEGKPDPFDPSLAAILDGKLFVVKDLTILLNRKDEADRFWGHLRAAYDGRLEKQSGTIGYQGKESIRFGFIGATTDGSIEGSLVRMSKLGERALYIRMQQEATTTEEDRDMGLRMLSGRGQQHIREQELNVTVGQIVHRAIKQVKAYGPSEPTDHTHVVVQKVIDLASILAKLRTAPMEDSQLPHERNPRIVKQFGTVCDAISLCSGRRKWGDNEVKICLKAVRSSLPSKVRLLLDYVATCSFFDTPSRYPTAATASRAIGVWRHSFAENQMRQWVSAGVLNCDGNRRYFVPKLELEKLCDLGVVIRPDRFKKKKKITVKLRRT